MPIFQIPEFSKTTMFWLCSNLYGDKDKLRFTTFLVFTISDHIVVIWFVTVSSWSFIGYSWLCCSFSGVNKHSHLPILIYFFFFLVHSEVRIYAYVNLNYGWHIKLLILDSCWSSSISEGSIIYSSSVVLLIRHSSILIWYLYIYQLKYIMRI